MSKQEDLGIRCLEIICEDEDFSVELFGNTYCSLAKDRKIDCLWQSNEKDYNGFYPCIRWKAKNIIGKD